MSPERKQDEPQQLALGHPPGRRKVFPNVTPLPGTFTVGSKTAAGNPPRGMWFSGEGFLGLFSAFPAQAGGGGRSLLCFLLLHLTWRCSHVRSIPASHRDVEGAGSLLLPLHWPHLFCLCLFWGLEICYFLFFSTSSGKQSHQKHGFLGCFSFKRR